jgi:parallel beta-helix repeat protein
MAAITGVIHDQGATATDRGGMVFNVSAYGAVPDGREVADGATTTGSTTVTSATAAFTAGDVGKSISLGAQVRTTIATVVNATTITTAAAATATATGVTLIFGTDNTPLIQAAISAAAPSRGVVYLPSHAAANFYLVTRQEPPVHPSAPVLYLTSGARLTGHRYGSRIKLMGAHALTIPMLYARGATHLEVDNLTFDGSRAVQDTGSGSEHMHVMRLAPIPLPSTQGCEDVSIHDCEFHDVRGDAVSVGNYYERVTIRNCAFRNTGRCGVFTATGTDLIVADNVFAECSPAFHNEPEGFDIDITGTRITGNLIRDSAAGIDMGGHSEGRLVGGLVAGNHISNCNRGINVYNCHDSKVLNNTIVDMLTGTGILVHGNSSDILVQGNSVRRCATNPFAANPSGGGPGATRVMHNLTLRDNDFIQEVGQGGTPSAIKSVRGVKVLGGRFAGGATRALEISAASDDVTDVLVDGVTFQDIADAYWCLYVLPASSTAVMNVTIVNCRFVGRAVPSAKESIRLNGPYRYLNISNNDAHQRGGVDTFAFSAATYVREGNRLGTLPLRSWGTAAPTSGTWNRGDRIANQAPTGAGSVSHWVCVTSGEAHLASTGSTTSGSNQVTAVTSIATWTVGDAISGAGIPANTTVAAVDAGTSTLTLSANATATAAGVALADAAFRSVLLV